MANPRDIYFRTMSTNEVHPAAFQPSITLNFTHDIHHAIQILNHRIAIVPDVDVDNLDARALPARSRMGILDWKTGALKVYWFPILTSFRAMTFSAPYRCMILAPTKGVGSFLQPGSSPLHSKAECRAFIFTRYRTTVSRQQQSISTLSSCLVFIRNST